MFENKSLWEIINMGGFTMYVLLACSVLDLAILLERLYRFAKGWLDREKFMGRITGELAKGEPDRAIAMCESERKPVAAVVRAGLTKRDQGEKVIQGALEREIALQTSELEQYTSVVGTIGNVAVYIGLFGTVIGIVRAFSNISRTGSGGISVVIGGVAEALICTATGLLVAVPAVVFYNYFVRRIERFVTEMEVAASEIRDLLVAARTSSATAPAPKESPCSD
jgi:biopolymer transport protein ExbB